MTPWLLGTAMYSLCVSILLSAKGKDLANYLHIFPSAETLILYNDNNIFIIFMGIFSFNT